MRFVFVTTTRDSLGHHNGFYRLHQSVILALNAEEDIEAWLVCVAQGQDEFAVQEAVGALEVHPRLTVTIMNNTLLTLSDARNFALHQVFGKPGVAGCPDIIAFPDDDCAYRVETLISVQKSFQKGYQMVVARHGDPIDNLLPFKDTGLPLRKALKAVSSNVMFLDYQLVSHGLMFDPDLGLGTKGKSAEDIDYFIRAWIPSRPQIAALSVSVIHPRKQGRQERYYRGNVLFYKRYKSKAPILGLSLVRQFFVGIALITLKRMPAKDFISAWRANP